MNSLLQWRGEFHSMALSTKCSMGEMRAGSKASVIVSLMMWAGFSTGAAAQGKVIPESLIQTLVGEINDNKNNFRLSEQDINILRKNLRVRRFDLNRDKRKEYFLFIEHHDWCGSGINNCAFWVYQKTSSGYKLLLESTNLRPLKTYTRGYKNLLGTDRGGWMDYTKTVYKYDGKRYQYAFHFYEQKP